MKLISFIYASYITACLFICFSTAHAQETFNGDLQQFEGRIQKALSNFYAMSLDCAMDQELQDELVREIIGNYLMEDGIYTPDLTKVPNKASLFSYKNYILSIWNTFKQYKGNIHEMEIQPLNMRILSAKWTTDKKGLEFVVSYQVNATLDDKRVFSGPSQAVISFPSLISQLNYRFKQIGVPITPASSKPVTVIDDGTMIVTRKVNSKTGETISDKVESQPANVQSQSADSSVSPSQKSFPNNDLIEAADKALSDNDYTKALQFYEAYLPLIEYKGIPHVYKAALAAYQLKQYEKSAKFYDMCIAGSHDLELSYIGSASSYKHLGNMELFLERTEAGLNIFPVGSVGHVTLEKLMFTYCMKEGQKLQADNKYEDAIYLYNKVVTLSNDKERQSSALYSIGATHYEKVKDDWGNYDFDKMDRERKKPIVERFKESLLTGRAFLVKSLELDPTKENALWVIELIDRRLSYALFKEFETVRFNYFPFY